jgi:hypothetical protein
VIIDFNHRHSAHCESGVTAGMINHHGLPLSEAMAFGVGGGLYFINTSFVKLYGVPMTSFRYLPGHIFKQVSKRLGIKWVFKTFRRPNDGMAALDAALDQGLPVGLRVGIYWLPYVPEPLRFQFNAHNLIVFGKKDGEYLISDPVFDRISTCQAKDLAKARFAKGTLAPKGTMYYPLVVPKNPDFPPAVTQGIKEVCRAMTRPFPKAIGVAGIRTLSRKVPTWPQKIGPEMARQYLAMLVRMQEEIGTGGAGFRFIWASFLDEAAGVLGRQDLVSFSGQMAKVGDTWRLFALKAARMCKRKQDDQEKYNELGELLYDLAEQEEAVYLGLKAAGF